MRILDYLQHLFGDLGLILDILNDSFKQNLNCKNV